MDVATDRQSRETTIQQLRDKKEDYLIKYDMAKLSMGKSDLTINRVQGEDYSLLTELVLSKSNENVFDAYNELDYDQ